MSIEQTAVPVLFLFAHQDDESFVYQKILDEVEGGSRVSCLFFTRGVADHASSSRRNAESIAVLSKLGVSVQNIHFLGDVLSIADGALADALLMASGHLAGLIDDQASVNRIYLPAWEGGHPDHDCLHAIGVIVSAKLGLLDRTVQYATYNGAGCIGPLFRTLRPLIANGPVEVRRISWHNRFRFSRYALMYPSQAKTWLGLFPMFVLHYLFWGTQTLQPVSIQRILERPHQGLLYYERRKFATYAQIQNKIAALIAHDQREA